MTKPTPEQIAKLPAWARNHIKALEAERDDAVRTWIKSDYASRPTAFSFPTCRAGAKGFERSYVQTGRIRVHSGEFWADLYPGAPGEIVVLGKEAVDIVISSSNHFTLRERR